MKIIPEKSFENTILASFMYDSDLLKETIIKPEYFVFNDSKEIFIAMQKLAIDKDLPLDEDFILSETNGKHEERLLQILSTNSVSNITSIEKEIIKNYKTRVLATFLNQTKNELLSENFNINEVLYKLNSFEINVDEIDDFGIEDIRNIKATKPEFFLEKICPIQKKEINLITAQAGKGKSLTCLFLLGKLASQGIKCYGWFSEDDKGATKHRFEQMINSNPEFSNVSISIAGKDKKLSNFIKMDRAGNFEATDFFHKFKKKMKNFDVILLDPYNKLICKNENDNVEASFLLGLLNEWIEKENKTLILIHHDGKGDGEQANKSRGASGIIGAVRIHYSLTILKDGEIVRDNFRRLIMEKTNHFVPNKDTKFMEKTNKPYFDIKIFNSSFSSKPIEIVFEDDKIDKEKPKNFDTGGIEMLFDDEDIPNEKNNKLIDNLKEKGFKFDD